MPELPEVETFVRQLKPLLLNKKIDSLTITNNGERLIGKQNLSKLNFQLRNKTIIDIRRLGKFIIFLLDDNTRINSHLRMTGRFIYSVSKLEHKHKRLEIKFDGGGYLNFIDIRKFATFDYDVGKNKLANIGKDALAADFNLLYLNSVLTKSNRSIYGLLLDQKYIAGIGNIYANEILFKTRVHPLKVAKSITYKESKKLWRNIKSVLTEAIAFKGTTLLDKSYTDLDGNYGAFANKLYVYGKREKKCTICKNIIQRLKIQQRTVYFCPQCQII